MPLHSSSGFSATERAWSQFSWPHSASFRIAVRSSLARRREGKYGTWLRTRCCDTGGKVRINEVTNSIGGKPKRSTKEMFDGSIRFLTVV
jgi:hypothetical protein